MQVSVVTMFNQMKSKPSLRTKGKKVLIIMDGYDEYKPGTNTHVDKALTKHCPEKLLDCTNVKRN